MSDAPEIDGFSGLTLIGRGASGAVYRARQDAMSRNVAIKVLQASTTDPHARERFSREVRTLGELSGHPSIVTTYTSGVTDDDRPYLVMDLMDSDISALAPASIPEAVEMVVASAEGLAEAHRRGVLHRDIKPANIFVDRYGQLRLGDFGLVGLSEAASITNASVGSPAYMAPELLANARASVSSDLYALAVTLYWLVEATLPFEAGDAGVAGLFHAILSNPHRAPEHMGSNLSAFVNRCLAKDPEQRPQSADDFIRELHDAVDDDETSTSLGATTTPIAPTHSVPGLGSSSDPGATSGPGVASGPGLTSGPGVASGPGVTSGPSAPLGFATTPPPPPQPPGTSVGGASPSGPYPPPGTISGPQGRRPNRKPWLVAAIVAVIALVAGGVVVATQLGDDPVAAADPVTGIARVRATGFGIPAGGDDPTDLVFETSGFLIEDGYLVTSPAPAVADSFLVEFEGEEVDADLIGMAECQELAVLRIDEDEIEGRHAFEWSSGVIGFGNNVRILGHNDDIEFEEFEVEVVSEPGPVVDGNSVHDVEYELDAVVPRETLGGPVLDRDGDVAGVAGAVNESSDLSYAIGVDEVEQVVDDIIAEDGDIQGLGIGFREAGGSIRVNSLRPGSLADDVGLQPGDEIIDIDDVGLVISDDPLSDYCEATNDVEDRVIPIRVRRNENIFVGEINGAELEQESTTELDYVEVSDDEDILSVEIPASWEVYDDPATADYDGAVISAQGPEGFLEYSVQPNRTPQEIVDILSDVFADDPSCTVGETVDYTDGVFTGLETPVSCDDQPDAIAKLIAATEDDGGTAISLLYTYDGSAAEEAASHIEQTFFLPGL